jgi:hypothetical protein
LRKHCIDKFDSGRIREIEYRGKIRAKKAKPGEEVVVGILTMALVMRKTRID